MLKQETLKEAVEAMDEGRKVRFITNLPDNEDGGRIYEINSPINSPVLSHVSKPRTVSMPSYENEDFIFFFASKTIYINPENVIGIEIYKEGYYKWN